MSNDLIHISLDVVIILGASLSAFFALKFFMKGVREVMFDTKTQVAILTNKVDKHVTAKEPHQNCPIHTLELKTVQSTLNHKMDREPCERIHESIDRRMNEMCLEMKGLTQSLLPLVEIQKTLIDIRGGIEKLDKKEET
jgi:hypothetical protein